MRRRWLLALVVVALALVAGRAAAVFYADALWYASLGAAPLWRARLWYTLLTRGLSAVATGAFVFVNLYAVRQSVVSLVLPRRVANLEIGEEVPGRQLVAAAAGLALLFGWILALPAESWQQLALVRHGMPFGETDPYFDKDLAYFVYWLPLEEALHVEALVTVLLVAALVAFLYALTPSLRRDRGRLYVSQYARRHFIALTTVLLVLLAWSFRLDAFRALLEGSGADGAFSFTDHHAGIPVNIALSFVALGAAIALFLFGWIGQMRAAATTLSVLLVFGIAISAATPIIMRRTQAGRSDGARDQPYFLLRATYSRRAFGVDRLLTGDSALRFGSLRAAAGAVSSWDPYELLRAAAFWRPLDAAAGIGWTARRGMVTAVLPLRPLDAPGDSSRTRWMLERVLAAGGTARGEPLRLPDSAGGSGGSRLAGPPLVYEGAPASLLVFPDTLDRIPAPALGPLPARLAFAWSRQHLHVLGGELPAPRPRAIIRRDVRERVSALAPFFTQGTAVTPVAAADTLYWVIDLYAVSTSYPLSQRDSLADTEYRYLHHAATAIVNALTGRVALLRDPALDPIGESWTRFFPEMFTDSDGVPRAVLAALPPAADGARTQARMLARYGRRGEMPPVGRLPPASDDSLPAPQREGFVALPRGETVAWSSPVLDANDHVTGLVVATGGAARATYWLPIPHPLERWSGIAESLRRALDDSVVAAARTPVRRGGVRAIAVGRGIAFAQSVFATPGDGPPELLLSAVRFGDAVTTGRTVSQALGAPMPEAADDGGAAAGDFRAHAAVLYAQMRAALQRGDWPAFGRAYDALGALLENAARRARQP